MVGIQTDEELEAVVRVKRKEGLITEGLQIGNINYQRCYLIIAIQKGEIKDNPVCGVGIDNYLRSVNRDNKQLFITECTKELRADGMRNASVNVEGNNIVNFNVTV